MLYNKDLRDILILSAKSYSSLLNKKMLVFIKSINKHFILKFEKTNFLHLTGVKTNLNNVDFFNKCYKGTIKDDEFYFNGDEQQVINSINKIVHLINIESFFKSGINTQLYFNKGHVKCTLALANKECTIGFTNGFPRTILDGDCLNYRRGIYRSKIKIKKF